MTTIGLYGGPLKSTIIKQAFGLCGQSATEFELTAEEFETGLTSMNALAATLGGFPYNMPANNSGFASDESGIPPDDVYGFTVMLAGSIAQNIGKAYAPNGDQATAKSALKAKYQVVPFRLLGRQTIRGAGNRNFAWRGPFFCARVSDDEPPQ